MNLFIVTSPFQYICANEARHAFKATNNILLYITGSTKKEKKQVYQLISETDDWQLIIETSRKNRTKNISKAIKEIKKKEPIETIYYSEYSKLIQQLIKKNIPAERHVYFDDGTMTLFDWEDFIEPKKTISRRKKLSDLVLKMNGVRPVGNIPFFENTILFSIFDIETPKKNEHQIVKNNLLELKNIYSSKKEQDVIVFIGQGNIDEKNRLDGDSYIKLIKDCTQKSDEEVIYIPHRTESAQLTKRIKDETNVSYAEFSMPIEVELLRRGKKPARIIGLCSTALFTLKMLFPETKIELIKAGNSEKEERIYKLLLEQLK
ncbi:glycosyltransferase family 52 [Oceanospirillum sanctuarii]|uniref:glycosyltransferase family 52 n=1 Tax=Oceanospirillum sanctuarii TaxID=1434821 RepID=UPI000A39C0AC|nr:glycosyltransferase family 52 [Oceanospirillum sanctuarii]